MQKNWSDVLDNSCLSIDYVELLNSIKHKRIAKIIMVGRKGRGFCFVALLKSGRNRSIPCVLMTKVHGIRYIKSPDVAHDFLVELGVKSFDVDTAFWGTNSYFDPHKASTACRLRKHKRAEVLAKRGCYLKKFVVGHARECELRARTYLLTKIARDRGWLEGEVDDWFEANWKNSTSIPMWVCKSSVVLATSEGLVPETELEVKVFVHLWWEANGPFNDDDDMLASVPKNIIDNLPSLNMSVVEFCEIIKEEVRYSFFPQ